MKALIIVDAQNDFFEKGALEVPDSNSIIPVINRIADKFETVIYTKDWHPFSHKSFASNHKGKKIYDVIDLCGIKQVLWPNHCIQNTFGAEMHKDIIKRKDAIYVLKGMDENVDSYSGFFDNSKIHDTGLNSILKENKITDTYISGLATEYCVKHTALDSVELKFNTYVIADATRPVNICPNDYETALNEMKNKGVKIIYSTDLQFFDKKFT